MSNDNTVLYYLTPGEVRGEMAQSMIEMLVHDATQGGGHIAGVVRVRSGATVAESRNGCVKMFLEHSEADWLLFVDSDMEFDPDALDRLFAHADAEQRPVIGGLCCGLDDRNGWFPVLYRLVELPEGPMTALVKPNRPELVPVDATGAAFLLIHRSVLEAIQARGFDQVYPWFQETALSGYPVGEDITFCLRARTCGFPIHVDAATEIGHAKTVVGRYSTHVGWTPPDAAREPAPEFEIVPA